jgi:hypothetical protein
LTIVDELRLGGWFLDPWDHACGLATRLLQLFAHHDHHILFLLRLCVWRLALEDVEAHLYTWAGDVFVGTVHVFCSWGVLSRHLLTTNYELCYSVSRRHEHGWRLI